MVESYYNKGRPIPEEEKAYIRTHFSYDAATGTITRNDRKGTGSYDKDGYLIIKINSRQYKAHRLAWFLFYGEFPEMEIDHINRDRTDNRISNLRESTRQENATNVKKTINEKTNVIGIYIDQCTNGLKKKYTTRFKGKTYRFYTLEDAIKFRKQYGYAV